MLTCVDASRLLSDRLERELRLKERFALGLHLAMCRGCARVAEQLRFLHQAMAAFGRRRK